MKYINLFIIVAGLALGGCSASDPVNTVDNDTVEIENTFKSDFGPVWKRSAEYTLALAQLMPEEYYDYKPTEDVRTFEEQLIHVVQNIYMLSSTYVTEENNPMDNTKEDFTKTEIIQMLGKACAYVDVAIGDIEEEKLSETINLFNSISVPRERVFHLMRDHMTHHRGQMIMYLRMKGIEPPRYTGW